MAMLAKRENFSGGSKLCFYRSNAITTVSSTGSTIIKSRHGIAKKLSMIILVKFRYDMKKKMGNGFQDPGIMRRSLKGVKRQRKRP